MLLTGKEYLESIRDGRRVYVGSEQVDDVTTHPAFRNAAHSFAAIYDRKRAPENRGLLYSNRTPTEVEQPVRYFSPFNL